MKLKLLTTPQMRERALLNAAVGAERPENTAILHLIGKYAQDVNTLLGLLRRTCIFIPGPQYPNSEAGVLDADLRAILAGQEKS